MRADAAKPVVAKAADADRAQAVVKAARVDVAKAAVAGSWRRTTRRTWTRQTGRQPTWWRSRQVE
ncbi:hypothetical protein C2E31_21365 [Rhodopirellula baltica]|nr:hypothetical protein C2E31_21365 [Rhodopirellula baltica]